jgi:hypothetical protein
MNQAFINQMILGGVWLAPYCNGIRTHTTNPSRATLTITNGVITFVGGTQTAAVPATINQVGIYTAPDEDPDLVVPLDMPTYCVAGQSVRLHIAITLGE